jgi:hypothetical protein
MTPEEYDKRKKLIEEERKVKIIKLNKEYALSNNKVKIGDIVKGHNVIILVEKIRIYSGFLSKGYPMCEYIGVCLTKKLKPYKSGEKGHVFQDEVQIL